MQVQGKTVVVVTEETVQGLKHVMGARSKGAYDPQLRGVYVDANEGFAVGADRHRMHAAPVCMEGGTWDMELGKGGVVLATPIEGEYPIHMKDLEKCSPRTPDADTFDIIMLAEDLRAVFARMAGPVRIRIRSAQQAVEFFGNTRRPSVRAYSMVMPLKWRPEHDETLVWRPDGDVCPCVEEEEEEENGVVDSQ